MSGYVRAACRGCGVSALVEDDGRPYVCASCTEDLVPDVDPAEAAEYQVGSWWSDARGGGAASGMFGAFDEVFNPAAARAREQVKGDHERVSPTRSAGDDALRDRHIVIRRPADAHESGSAIDDGGAS